MLNIGDGLNGLRLCENEDYLRETSCAEPVSAFAVSCSTAVWCTVQRSFFVWDSAWEEPLLVAQLDFVPNSVCITADHCVFVADETHVAMYYLTLGEEESNGVGTTFERQFGYAYHFGLVLHMSIAPDASLAALATEQHLIIVDCTSKPPFLDEDDSPLIMMNCSEWYNERGCSLTCFASAERLFVLSSANHLVSIRPDMAAHRVEMERDGHVLTRAHNVTCMAASSIRDALLVIGLSDGTIKLLQMDTLDVFRTLDLVVLLEKMVAPHGSHLGAGNQPWKVVKGRGAARRAQERPPPPPANVEYAAPGTMFQAFVCDVAVGGKYITASLPEAVLYIDKNSFFLEEEKVFFFDEDVGVGRPPKAKPDNDENDCTPTTLCASNGCWLALNELAATMQHFVAAQPLDYGSARLGGADGEEENLVHSTTPPPDKWLTRMALPSESDKKGGKSGGKPVTFGHPIKSAGYSDVPWSEKQKQKQKKAKTGGKNIGEEDKKTSNGELQVTLLEPYEAHKLKPLSAANRILASSGNLHHSAITCATFSPAGDALLTGGSDSTVYHLRFPVAKYNGDGFGLRGHTAAVFGVHTNLSLKTTLVLSCSADSTVCLWKPGSRETPFISHKVPKANEIRAARFFYTDKFVSYTSGNSIELCKFILDNGGGDLDRKRNDSCFSAPLAQVSIDAQHITAMDCINHFPSSIMVAAGSNKSVTILDMISQQKVRVITDAHTRGIHKVTMCSNSRFVQNCSSAIEHMYLTAGLDNAVNMWDLRQPKSARQFALHKNSALNTLGLSISPSGSMFAVGSEDRSVYIYDVSSGGSPLDVIHCNDMPTALAWHPVDPILAIGTSSGSMLLYGQR